MRLTRAATTGPTMRLPVLTPPALSNFSHKTIALRYTKIVPGREGANMSVSVDCNAGENALFEALSAELRGSVELQRKPLPLGDVDVAARGLRLIIERKSIADLEASIVDGRYKSQMDRAREMVRENPGVKFGVLVVGDLPEFDKQMRSVPASTLYAVLSKLQLRDGFTVLVAKTTKDAASIVAQTAKHALNGAFPANGSLGEASSVLGKRPRHTSNPLEAALSSLHGVSPAMAKAISKTFLTGARIFEATEEQLAGLKVGKRSLGKVVAARIKQVFS
jgi:ERCC4-type nuclease